MSSLSQYNRHEFSEISMRVIVNIILFDYDSHWSFKR